MKRRLYVLSLVLIFSLIARPAAVSANPGFSKDIEFEALDAYIEGQWFSM